MPILQKQTSETILLEMVILEQLKGEPEALLLLAWLRVYEQKGYVAIGHLQLMADTGLAERQLDHAWSKLDLHQLWGKAVQE